MLWFATTHRFSSSSSTELTEEGRIRCITQQAFDRNSMVSSHLPAHRVGCEGRIFE
jgi:hypothetical protein